MKIKTDFVTNSSSSSFIVKAKDIRLEHLLNDVLKKLFLEFARSWYAEDEATDEEILKDYIPQDCLTEDKARFFVKIEKDPDTNEDIYIVDNNCYSRFDFSIVEDVLDTFKINWTYGECD